LFTDLQKDAVIANELERLTRQISFMGEDNARLREDNCNLVETVNCLTAQLKDSEEALSCSQKTVLDLNAVIRVKDAEIRNRDNKIRVCNEAIDALNVRVADLTNW